MRMPVVTALGIAVNTLQAGDDLETTGAAAGTATLNDTTAPLSIGANPAFATNVTMNGVTTLNITGNAGTTTGFQGNITGLLVENSTNTIDPIQLGGTGQGLKTLLTNINITNRAGRHGRRGEYRHPGDGCGRCHEDYQRLAHGTNLGKTAGLGARQKLRSLMTPEEERRPIPTSPMGPGRLTAKNNANLQLEQSVTTSPPGALALKAGRWSHQPDVGGQG